VHSYTVSKDDSLWKISGKRKVYADSYQWPLLFIANKDQIQDPDVIKPGMVLKVSRNVEADKIADAVQKAHDTPRFEPHVGPREKLPIDY
jgi:LysM repeat protein